MPVTRPLSASIPGGRAYRHGHSATVPLMTRWDYLMMKYEQNDGWYTDGVKEPAPNSLTILKRLGAEGWELVSQTPGLFVFKRPL